MGNLNHKRAWHLSITVESETLIVGGISPTEDGYDQKYLMFCSKQPFLTHVFSEIFTEVWNHVTEKSETINMKAKFSKSDGVVLYHVDEEFCRT